MFARFSRILRAFLLVLTSKMRQNRNEMHPADRQAVHGLHDRILKRWDLVRDEQEQAREGQMQRTIRRLRGGFRDEVELFMVEIQTPLSDCPATNSAPNFRPGD